MKPKKPAKQSKQATVPKGRPAAKKAQGAAPTRRKKPIAPIAGYLEVGINPQGEVVMNLPEGTVGHIVFSANQARALAIVLNKQANAVDPRPSGRKS